MPEPICAVAIVGARAASSRDVETAQAIAGELASGGVVIVSGGAVGVDAAAHRGALQRGRPAATAAVLGCGLHVGYPARNQSLFGAICAAGGALVSQFKPDAPPRRWHFVLRNRTMAGMADAVLIVAASRQSGALHTARAARELGRVVAAVPGTPGCETLIASGALAVRNADDLVRALDGGDPAGPDIALPGRQSDAGQVLSCLDDASGYDADHIALATGLGIRQVTRALTNLELDGLAILLPGRNYIRSTLARSLLAR